MKQEFYMTIGVKESVPIEIVLLMIQLAIEIKEKDYLQVFRIKPLKEKSILTMSQEVPVYEKSIDIKWQPDSELKLFYIDDVIMMSHEY